jgi:tetratricopeptide (TPR) repeat protein
MKATLSFQRSLPKRRRGSKSASWKGRLLMVLGGLSLGWCAWGETVVFPEFTVASAQSYLQAQALAFQAQAGAGDQTYFLLARLQNRLGHQDEAERLARQALGCDPKRADIQSFLGKIFLAEGRLQEAADSFRKAVELDPKAAGDYRRLGMVLDQLGDHEGARKAFSAGLDLAPADATGQLMLGRLLLDHGAAKEAISHLEKACQLDGTSVNAFYVLAQAQTQIGDKEAARETLQTFQRLRVGDKESLLAQDANYDNEREMRHVTAGFHLDAADFFFERGRKDLAEAHLKQATQVAPAESQACEILAQLYLQGRRELPAALTLCRRCVSLQPTAAHYDLLARACFLNGQNDEARAASARAVRLDPNQAVYREHYRRFNEKP